MALQMNWITRNSSDIFSGGCLRYFSTKNSLPQCALQVQQMSLLGFSGIWSVLHRPPGMFLKYLCNLPYKWREALPLKIPCWVMQRFLSKCTLTGHLIFYTSSTKLWHDCKRQWCSVRSTVSVHLTLILSLLFFKSAQTFWTRSWKFSSRLAKVRKMYFFALHT